MDRIDLGGGWFVYSDAKPPFKVETFSGGMIACILDSLGRNRFHTLRGAVLTDPVSAVALVETATSILDGKK